MTQARGAVQQQQGRFDPNQYVTVAERIDKFHEKYPDGRIETSIEKLDLEAGFVCIKASVYRGLTDEYPCGTGHAYEFKSEGYVQRSSFVEVCETSAVGRALAMAGFEVKRGVASREEMEKASRHAQREQPPKEEIATYEAKYLGERNDSVFFRCRLPGKDKGFELAHKAEGAFEHKLIIGVLNKGEETVDPLPCVVKIKETAEGRQLIDYGATPAAAV